MEICTTATRFANSLSLSRRRTAIDSIEFKNIDTSKLSGMREAAELRALRAAATEINDEEGNAGGGEKEKLKQSALR